MSGPACCRRATCDREKQSRPVSRRRCGWEAAGWLLSTATLALMPKCPICLAAYIAMFSGIGISISSATLLRTSLIVVCISALFFLVLKRFLPLPARKRAA